MKTTEAWEIINEKEELEYHCLMYFQGNDADDLLFAINNVLNLPKVRMSPRHARLVEIATCVRNSKKMSEKFVR